MPDDKRPPLADLVIGDRFWLAYAQEIVRGAIKGPEDRAAQLTTSIGWFWTVYSAAGVVALAVGAERLSMAASALIVAPSVLLIVAYWQAARVGRPQFVQFDPRVPVEIEHAFEEAARYKQRQLRIAEKWTAAAAFVVAASLALSLAFARAPEPSLSARFDPDDPSRLVVVANVPRQVAVLFVARPATAVACSGASPPVLERSGADGAAHVALRVAPNTAQHVTASWVEDKVERSVSLDLKPGG